MLAQPATLHRPRPPDGRSKMVGAGYRLSRAHTPPPSRPHGGWILQVKCLLTAGVQPAAPPGRTVTHVHHYVGRDRTQKKVDKYMNKPALDAISQTFMIELEVVIHLL